MAQLTKADLFNKPWPKPVKVEINLPDLAGEVYVRILTAGELDALGGEAVKIVDGEAMPNFAGQRGRLVALCACDETGKRLFEDDDADEIGRRPGPWVDAIYDAATEANAMTQKAKEKARKNSSTTPS